MKIYNTFNPYFTFIFFLLIINCFGQKHSHDHPTNLVESNDIIEKDLLYLSSSSLSSQEDEQSSIINKMKVNTPETCFQLPKPFESSLGLVENQILQFINLFPEVLRTTLFERTDDREKLVNRIWLGSICMLCFLFSLIFFSMNTKRLQQSKSEKQIRIQCQKIQEHNDLMEFEYATFKRKHQKLLNEMDEIKSVSVRYEDDILELRKKCTQLQEDLKAKHSEGDNLKADIDCKQDLIKKHEFDMQKQLNIVAHLNNEILEYQQELEKARKTIDRIQSNDLSLERFEKLQEIIYQLKEENSAQVDQLQQVQAYANQLDIDNNEFIIKMKKLKDLLKQRDDTIARIPEDMLNDIMLADTKNNSDQNQQLLSSIDHDIEKANQHMHDLHAEIEEKTHRVKEFGTLLNQEKDRCRELETKLKVILELRERDTHLHIRQLGQTDTELRKARTDTERVRILQQQLELKQQQLDDVQKVLASEQTKFSEECSKLQHETHEKWMEVKRLTRELDSARKECEGLRRQITKYANSDRSSQEKTTHKPVSHHLNNSASRLSSEPETNGNSPPPLPYQSSEKSIDQSNDSSTISSVNMFRMKPPSFVFLRPCFRPQSALILPNRFPIPFNGVQGIKAKDNFFFNNKNKT